VVRAQIPARVGALHNHSLARYWTRCEVESADRLARIEYDGEKNKKERVMTACTKSDVLVASTAPGALTATRQLRGRETVSHGAVHGPGRVVGAGVG
jgi:hypothetical protein